MTPGPGATAGGRIRPAGPLGGGEAGPRAPAEVWKLLWHLVERCHEVVHSQGNSKVSASTHRLEGWLGRLKPRARLTRGLKTEAGALNFVCLMARGMA